MNTEALALMAERRGEFELAEIIRGWSLSNSSRPVCPPLTASMPQYMRVATRTARPRKSLGRG